MNGYTSALCTVALLASTVTIGATGHAAIARLLGVQHFNAAQAADDGNASGEYSPMTPARLLDTRDGTGLFGVPAKLLGGEVRNIQIAGQLGIPATGVLAVVMNATVTSATAGGWLAAWPAGAPQPNVSILNFVAGQTVSNLVTIGLGSDGQVSLTALQGQVDVILDVVGSYATATGTPGGRFHATPAIRLLDTRAGFGKPIQPEFATQLLVTGVGGIPPSDVAAIAVNITVTDATDSGFITAWPSDVKLPLASNVNFVAGVTVANLAIIRVPANGKINLYNSAGITDLIVDVAGWYDTDRTTEAGRFIPFGPARAVDTRTLGQLALGAQQVLATEYFSNGRLATHWFHSLALNVTITQPSRTAYATLYEGETRRPTTSNINFTPDVTVANHVLVLMSAAGVVDLFNADGDSDVVIDVFGGFTNELAPAYPMLAGISAITTAASR